MSSVNATAPRLLTVDETATLVTALTGHPCSPRQVRYLLVNGGLGTDTAVGHRGQTRMLGMFDVALMRTAATLQAQGSSAAVSRTVLTYLRNDIILAWRSAANQGLAVQGLRGTLEPAPKGKPAWASAWVLLRDMWRDLDVEIQKVRTAKPTVWAWKDVAAQDAASVRGRTYNH